ncbi:MAG: prephenate dehydratase [Alphaproteobacteria bacterium]
MSENPENIIAYQGYPGAYSQMACNAKFPLLETMPCPTFELAMDAVREGKAKFAMLPVENSVAGRVADIHSLLPNSNLYIVGEHYQRIEHCLMACKGATIDSIKTVHSHIQALSQCRKMIKKYGFERCPEANTAIAAKNIALDKDKTKAVIASRLSAEIYGLDILIPNIEDSDHNTTRFLVMSKDYRLPPRNGSAYVTSFIFKVKNIPAALYKSLGGFATNGVNMTKLESYLGEGDFVAAQFYADVEAHPEDRGLKLAMEELSFFSEEINILGTYLAHPYRFLSR